MSKKIFSTWLSLQIWGFPVVLKQTGISQTSNFFLRDSRGNHAKDFFLILYFNKYTFFRRYQLFFKLLPRFPRDSRGDHAGITQKIITRVNIERPYFKYRGNLKWKIFVTKPNVTIYLIERCKVILKLIFF